MKRLLVSAALVFAVLFSQVALTAPPANVVRVHVQDHGRYGSAGTGTQIRVDLVITNEHVVRDRATNNSVKVRFQDGTTYKAVVVKTDKIWDLATLRIQPILLPPIELGERVKLGDTVTVCGYGSGTFASDSGKVTGFYHPMNHSAPDWLQIAAKVRDGDSGGPILKDGKLVGVLFGFSDGTYGTSVDRVQKFLEGVE